MRSNMATVMLMMAAMLACGVTLGSDDAPALESVVQNLALQVTSLQARLTSVENDLHQLQAKENERVVFMASISEGSVAAAPVGHVIPFTHVVTNVGNAYDTATSAFTAPYEGQYMLFVSVDVSPDYMRLGLAINGHIIIHGHNDGDQRHIYTGGAITLNEGDVVTVVHGRDVVGAVDGGEEAIFSGFKI